MVKAYSPFCAHSLRVLSISSVVIYLYIILFDHHISLFEQCQKYHLTSFWIRRVDWNKVVDQMASNSEAKWCDWVGQWWFDCEMILHALLLSVVCYCIFLLMRWSYGRSTILTGTEMRGKMLNIRSSQWKNIQKLFSSDFYWKEIVWFPNNNQPNTEILWQS